MRRRSRHSSKRCHAFQLPAATSAAMMTNTASTARPHRTMMKAATRERCFNVCDILSMLISLPPQCRQHRQAPQNHDEGCSVKRRCANVCNILSTPNSLPPQPRCRCCQAKTGDMLTCLGELRHACCSVADASEADSRPSRIATPVPTSVAKAVIALYLVQRGRRRQPTPATSMLRPAAAPNPHGIPAAPAARCLAP